MSKIPCSVPSCNNPSAKRGWCNGHYLRWYRHGDLRETEPIGEAEPIMHTLETIGPLFWDQTETMPDGCIRWTGATTTAGYGRIQFSRKEWYAHRLAWTLTYGEIPAGMEICHRCDVPGCVNPDHLFLGNHTENMRDARRKGRLATGDRHPGAKLTADEVREVRARRMAGETTTSLAAAFGATTATISRITTGQAYRNVT